MLIISTLSLLISSAVTFKRDMSILFNRMVITSLFYCLLQSFVAFPILSSTGWYKDDYINFSMLIFIIGFLFKVSAAPFHFWSPEVYDAIPTIVTTFVAIIAKISIFIFLLELVYYTNHYLLHFHWTYGLLVSSLLSLMVGTVLGLTQFRIKRLFAYSTISHLVFILLALIKEIFFYPVQHIEQDQNT